MNMIMNRMEKLSLKKVMLTVLMAALVFVVLAPFSAIKRMRLCLMERINCLIPFIKMEPLSHLTWIQMVM